MTLTKRMESIEKAVYAANAADAGEIISAEDSALLAPYLAARRCGIAQDQKWPEETHRAMYRYLSALATREELRRRAGVSLPSIAATLTGHRARVVQERAS